MNPYPVILMSLWTVRFMAPRFMTITSWFLAGLLSLTTFGDMPGARADELVQVAPRPAAFWPDGNKATTPLLGHLKRPIGPGRISPRRASWRAAKSPSWAIAWAHPGPPAGEVSPDISCATYSRPEAGLTKSRSPPCWAPAEPARR